jgi:hypothetical protein
MLSFFRRAAVPDGSQLTMTVTGNTANVALIGAFSFDDGPTNPWDPGTPLPLRSPHQYVATLDVTALATANVTVDVSVTDPGGARVGSPYQLAIAATANDLNTIRCDLSTAA